MADRSIEEIDADLEANLDAKNVLDNELRAANVVVVAEQESMAALRNFRKKVQFNKLSKKSKDELKALIDATN